jgi:hypothetical protein
MVKLEERILENTRKVARGIKRKALPILLATAMLGGVSALPVSKAEAGWIPFVRKQTHERNLNLNIKISSKPEEVDIYYAPIYYDSVKKRRNRREKIYSCWQKSVKT